MSHPFIIWTLQRTGGTSLTELLMDMSEHRQADHEPFNWRRAPRQFGYIAQAWAESKDEVALRQALAGIFAERYLIKHCYELHPGLNVRLMEALANTDYRHIHLLRRDEVSRLVSKFVAEAHGTWFKDYSSKVYAEVFEGKRKLNPLPVKKVVEQYTYCRGMTEEIRRWLREFKLEFREVYYEDLYLGDRSARLEHLIELLGFLGFDPEAIEKHRSTIENKIFQSGQNTASVMRFVPNLREVTEALIAAGCPPPPGDVADPGATERDARHPSHRNPGAGDFGRPASPPSRPSAAARRRSDSADAIHELGYRNFVGGDGAYWEKIADLQFEFLKHRGLQPQNRFIDIGCGALRGATRFIRYLAPACYHGIEKHVELIIYGVALELGTELFREKMPRFVVSANFEFLKFGDKFTFGIAQSLFTHLPAKDIFTCLAKLHRAADPGCRLYASFFETVEDSSAANAARSHSQRGFRYSAAELRALGAMTGWQTIYIGEWGHPRGQHMMEFRRS